MGTDRIDTMNMISLSLPGASVTYQVNNRIILINAMKILLQNFYVGRRDWHDGCSYILGRYKRSAGL